MVSIHHDKKICYFHVPKTAGSYIQQSLTRFYNFTSYNQLARYDLDEFKISEKMFKNGKTTINNTSVYATNPYSSKKLGINRYYSTSQMLLKTMYLDEITWNDLYKFTFVRDPYSRFISSWNYIIHGFKNENIMNDEKYGKDDFDKYKDIGYLIDNKELLTDIAYNHVFVTQYSHIINKDGVNNMNFIGKTETLEEDLTIVLNNLGFNDIIHKQKTDVNKTEHKPYKEYYTQKILDFVNDFFDDDFTHFNYTKYNTLSELLSAL